MKLGIVFSLFLFLMATPAHSETLYIRDDIEVMVRTGPGNDRRIIAMPRSGTPVEVLEALDDWTMVRLRNDKEGWMMTRYLSPGPPAKEIIATLKSENEVLSQQNKILIEETARFKKERKALHRTLSAQTKTAKSFKKSYEALKKGASEYLNLKASYEKVSEDLAAKTRQQAELEEKLRNLEDTQPLHWLAGGAAILFVGIIVGIMARRPRRRPSLL